VIFYKYYNNVTVVNLAIIAVLFGMFTVHMGCQQKYYKGIQVKNGEQNHTETIDAYEVMCKDSEHLRYTRFFGPGMLTIFVVVMVWWVWYKKINTN
jgi:hypothetical protein